jgi:DHA1 family bicyclomycin/chloramphenicol resistance-like MFS transporter
MLGPFSIDAYLPAFPNIQASLGATPLEVQQSLTFYMLAFAAMVLWHGALADAFGRRNVVLVSLVMFAIGTLGCASAHTVHYLWVFRVMQGVSAGAGVVVGRAIIRDLYDDAAAARLLSMVTMIFSIAPAVAPILGGWIVTLFDWRAIFLSLLAYTVLLFIYCYRRLPETLPPHKRQPFNPRYLARNYGDILRSPLFHMKSGVVALNFAGLFVYIAAAPEFLPKHLGLGPSQFGWLFIPAVSGIFLGALAANRLAGRMVFSRQIAIGYCFMLAAVTFTVTYHSLFPPALTHSVLAMALGQAAFALASLACWLTSRQVRRMRAVV